MQNYAAMHIQKRAPAPLCFMPRFLDRQMTLDRKRQRKPNRLQSASNTWMQLLSPSLRPVLSMLRYLTTTAAPHTAHNTPPHRLRFRSHALSTT
jgi:hypothetical protein